MNKLPAAYSWLAREGAPRHLVAALGLVGTREIVGPNHNPEILRWARELGAGHIFPSDEVPWCGLALAWVMHQVGRPYPVHFYRAREWSTWGEARHGPALLGDIAVFSRDGGGHVGIIVGEDAGAVPGAPAAYHVLGGNQSNAFGFTRIAKPRAIAVRRPPYHTPPQNLRTVRLAASGSLSTNEA